MQAVQQLNGVTIDSTSNRTFFLRRAVSEPFRLFFPAATLAGIVGVALWPLHFLGALQSYPGESHARIMAQGLFGGFILGFLGTAMPRMLSARSLRTFETIPLLLGYIAMVIAYAFAKV